VISKPILTIDKFSGMSDQGGIYYLDGFSVENGGQSLDENYRVYPEMTAEDLDDSNFFVVKGMIFISRLANSNFSSNTPSIIMATSSGRIYGYHPYSNGIANGEIGGIAASGTFFYSFQPDIAEMKSQNIIYTSARHISLVVRGKTNTTATDKVVDSDGRDFDTLGFANGDKVTNIITGQQYTITSITTTSETNDTLNFAAEPGKTNTDNDEFMVIKLTWKDLLGEAYSNRGIHFSGQTPANKWARPIRQSSEIGGGGYLIGNGNYIALLGEDEETLDSEFKQLPFGFQLLAMEIGNLGDILVSAYDKQGRGHLLYWDGFSENWNEVIQVSAGPMALHPYKNGWVYFVEGTLYFTNGRDIEKIVAHPNANSRDSLNVDNFNGITSYKDKIMLGCSGSSERLNNGVYVFDGSGLTFFKCDGGATSYTAQYGKPVCLEVLNTFGASDIYGVRNQLWIGGGSSLSTMSEYRANTVNTKYRSVMFKLDLKQETQIKEVWLNLQHTSNAMATGTNVSSEITVNYGNGSLSPFRYLNVTIDDTTTINNTVGNLYPGYKNEIYDVNSGSLYAQSGQRFHITDIADAGTTNEVWTISPALSTDAGSSIDLKGLGVNQGETKNVSLSEMNKPIRFNVNFFGSIMYLEVVVRGGSDKFPISIKNIQLF
jgi:hypothetical protein